MFKSAIKKLLPQPALNAARLAIDMRGLARTTEHAFPTENLKARQAIDLQTIWSSSDTKTCWEEDFHRIKTILRPEDLDRGVNPGDRQAIYYLIKALKPQNVLEIGTHIGASTLLIARALTSNGFGKVTTVDIYDVNAPENSTWASCGASACPRDMLESAGCANLVTFSDEGALPFMQRTEEKFDFIFLDGDHKAAAVYREISAALEILALGGVILLHDVFPYGKALYPDNNIIHGPWQAAARIMREVPDLSILPLGDLPWPTKQGVNTTTLALAVKA